LAARPSCRKNLGSKTVLCEESWQQDRLVSSLCISWWLLLQANPSRLLEFIRVIHAQKLEAYSSVAQSPRDGLETKVSTNGFRTVPRAGGSAPLVVQIVAPTIEGNEEGFRKVGCGRRALLGLALASKKRTKGGVYFLRVLMEACTHTSNPPLAQHQCNPRPVHNSGTESSPPQGAPPQGRFCSNFLINALAIDRGAPSCHIRLDLQGLLRPSPTQHNTF
jgi:hypothetical protein